MKLIYLALLVGTLCVGQTVCPDGQLVGCPEKARVLVGHFKSAPLKCGKYEHLVTTDTGQPCFDDPHMMQPNPKGRWCSWGYYPSKCAPDLHVVTEREWQELMARLKKLEKQP